MVAAGIALATLSGLFNGLFTAPMKLERRWKWENTWLVFIVVACLILPAATLALSGFSGVLHVLSNAPPYPVAAALFFGFLWGFGAICFGKSIPSIGISMANTLVIGLSAAMGSLVPLFMTRPIHFGTKQLVLIAGVAALLAGVGLCGKAGRLRDGSGSAAGASVAGYLLAVSAGILSAIFNIGYTLARPISDHGVRDGLSRFAATNIIWFLMLGAGSIPNIVYCVNLSRRNQTARLLHAPFSLSSWGNSVAMGLLWGGSILLYGAATPHLGSLGPSVGWPLSLAAGLVVANLIGLSFHEWRDASRTAVQLMLVGLTILIFAIVLCGISARLPE